MKIRTILITIITVILLIATVSFLFFSGNKYEPPALENPSKESILLLKYTDGEVVLFKDSLVIEKYPNLNFDILPTEDKILLEDGILVSSIADAHKLVEDYDG